MHLVDLEITTKFPYDLLNATANGVGTKTLNLETTMLNRNPEEFEIGNSLAVMHGKIRTKWDEISDRLLRLNMESAVMVDANYGQSEEHHSLMWAYDNDERKLIVRMSGKGIAKQTIYVNLVDMKIETKIKMLKFAPALIAEAISTAKQEFEKCTALIEIIEGSMHESI